MKDTTLIDVNKVNRDTYRWYDYFDELDAYKKDWYLVYKVQCENTDKVQEITDDCEEQWLLDDEINDALRDEEAIIITYWWDKPTPQYVIDEATEYFDK